MTHPAVEGQRDLRGPRSWGTLTLLAFAQFMLIVDISVVQVALPSVGEDLGLDRASVTWVVTAYTPVFGGLMVLGGRMTDALGARRMLLTGLTIFTAASLLCGIAPTGVALIAGRAAQGIGAALLSPAALAVITTTFTGQARNRALGVWAAIGGAGVAAGVLLGGLLVSGPGWQWVFFINVPIGVAGLVLVPLLVRVDPRLGTRRGLDVPGAVVVTSATALLIYGLVNAGDAGWGSASTLATLGAAVAGYVLFGVVESRAATPLMRPQTLARRPVVSGTFLMLIATGVMLGLFFLTTLYVQHIRGLSALETGLMFLPVAIATTIGAQAGAHLIGRVGGRAVAAAGFALTAAGAAMLTQIPADGSVWAAVLPGFVVAAVGLGPIFVTATTTTLANVPPDEAGVASGVVNTFHELGGSIGVAVVSTIAAASISAGAPGVGAIGGFASGYLACAIAAGAGALIAGVLVPGGRPQAVAGHGHGTV